MSGSGAHEGKTTGRARQKSAAAAVISPFVGTMHGEGFDYRYGGSRTTCRVLSANATFGAYSLAWRINKISFLDLA
jgi:hypothetical protein